MIDSAFKPEMTGGMTGREDYNKGCRIILGRAGVAGGRWQQNGKPACDAHGIQGNPLYPALCQLRCLGTVSYTHLDVYKRQVVESSRS